jgi:hypothetical protein
MQKPETSWIVNQRSIAVLTVALFFAAAIAAGGLPSISRVASMPLGICAEIESEEDRVQRIEESIESYAKPQLEAATERLNVAKQNAAASPGEPAEIVEAKRALAKKERELAVARTELAGLQTGSEQIGKAEARIAELKRQRDITRADYDRAQAVKSRLDDDPEVKQLRSRIQQIGESLAADIGADSTMDPAQLKRNLESAQYKGEQRDSRPPRFYALHRNLEKEQERANKDGADEILRQIAALRTDLKTRVAELERARRDLPLAERRALESLTEEQRKALNNTKDYEQAHAAVIRAEAEMQQLKDKQRGDAAWAQRLKEQIADLEREVAAGRQSLATAERNTSGPQKELKDATVAFESAERRLKGAQSDLARQKKLVEDLKAKKTQLRESVRNYISLGGNYGSAAHTENVSGNKQTCLQNLTKAREAFEAAAALWRTSGCSDAALDRAIQKGLEQVSAYQCKGEGLDERPSDGLIPVPGVINEDKDKALRILRQAGLDPVAIEYMKPAKPELQHRVSSQDPPPGTRTRPRGPVSVFYFGDYSPGDSGGFKDLGPSTDKSSTSSATADPNNRHVQGVNAAIANCDFDRARASLDQYAPADANDPWVAGKYKEIFEAQDRVEAARGMLLEAQGLLQQPEPSPDDIASAIALVKQARSTAPSCLSQIISRLTPALTNATAAANQRQRERDRADRAATSEALGTLLTGLTGILSQARGGSPPGPPVTGGGSGGQAGDCGGCAISGLGRDEAVNYVYARTYTSNGCPTTMYTIISLPPQKDDQGRPRSSFTREQEVQMSNAYGQKVCGPCGSYAQAQAPVRSSCPNPRVQNIVR